MKNEEFGWYQGYPVQKIIHDDQCENSRGWPGFPCECEERKEG
jgi:hypothetical protein